MTFLFVRAGCRRFCIGEDIEEQQISTSSNRERATYDIAGNVINDGNGNQRTYDAENTMATDAGVTYDYDADGVRTEKPSGTMYWPGPFRHLGRNRPHRHDQR
jgi:hypothetical protein